MTVVPPQRAGPPKSVSQETLAGLPAWGTPSEKASPTIGGSGCPPCPKFKTPQTMRALPPAVRKVVARAFDHAGAQGDDQCGVTARLSKLTSGSG
jgi:hypothetical protein